MVEIAIVLDMNCSAVPPTWEIAVLSAEEEELQEICPISVSPRAKQGHTCDALVWHVHLPIDSKIMCENRRVWNGPRRCQFLKETLFFLKEWNVFQLNLQLAEFSILLFSPLKNTLPLTLLCILQQDIPSQCICSRDFVLVINGIRTAAFEVLWHSLI